MLPSPAHLSCHPARHALWLALGLATACAAWAQPADAERAQRRLQLQVQALQQQVQAAQAAKALADSERDALAKKRSEELRAAARVRQALQQSEKERQALVQERATLQSRVAALDTQIVEHKRATEEALAAKDLANVQTVRTHDGVVVGWRTRLQQQTELLSDCTAKNQRLVGLGAELLQRYRDKNVGDIWNQREPVLGFGELLLYEVMQGYRDRTDAERFDLTRPVAIPAAVPTPPR